MALKYIKKKDINLKFTSCKVKISDRLPYRALLNDLEQGLIDLAVVEYEELLNEDYKNILYNLTGTQGMCLLQEKNSTTILLSQW